MAIMRILQMKQHFGLLKANEGYLLDIEYTKWFAGRCKMILKVDLKLIDKCTV